jgi:hypothetical protein
MHRKSLEAAEHIRKQDENELFNENLSPSTESSSSIISTSISPSVKIIINQENENNSKDDLKSESVANLRAKAKEHSAKLMEDVNIINNKYQINNNNNERKITENNSTSDAEDTNSYSLNDEDDDDDNGSV